MVEWQPKEVAWIADEYVAGEIAGVVVRFHGLGNGALRQEPDPWEAELAALGALVVWPYYGPWSWMNREARAMVDALIPAVYRAYNLGDDVPLILTGDSMGGSSALLYARYTIHHPVACFANCPVGDMTYHFRERPDLPRTMYHAFGSYTCTMQEALEEHSPLHQAAQMPDIDYLIVHGDEDTAVNEAIHADRLVAAMRARELRVTYRTVPGMGHCGPLPSDVSAEIMAFMRRALRN